MSTAVVLKFEGRRLHAFKRAGDDLLWFVLADVCEVLGLTNPAIVAERLDDDQKGLSNAYTLGGSQRVLIVSEDAVYDIATRSRKPVAKRFKRWLYREVLPEIRRTGSYQGGTVPLDALIGELQPALDLLSPPTAPSRPVIEREEGTNVVHVRHKPEECERQHDEERRERWEQLRRDSQQGAFNFGPSPPSPAEKALNDLVNEAHINALCGVPAHHWGVDRSTPESERWTDQHEGIDYELTLLAGDGRWRPLQLSMMRAGYPDGLVLPLEMSLYDGLGVPVLLNVDRDVPLPVILRAYDRLPTGDLTEIAKATIAHFFDD